MNNREEVTQRIIFVLPILCSLLCHAIALERWLLAVPAALGLLFLAARPAGSNVTSRSWYVVIVAGLLIGLVIPAAEVSAGPLPPAAAAALTGVATAIALFAVYLRRTTIAWSAGWALVAVSGKTVADGPLRFALFAFLISSLLAVAWYARLVGNRLRGWAVFAVFATALALSTAGVAALVQRIDRLFLGTVENFVANNTPSKTTGLGNRLVLSKKSSITPSTDPVLELSELTGYLRARVMDQFDGSQWTTSTSLMTKIGNIGLTSSQATVSRQVDLIFLDDLNNSIPSPAGTTEVRNAKPALNGGWIFRGKPEGVLVSLSGSQAERLPSESLTETDYLYVPPELQSDLVPFAIALAGDAVTNTAKAASMVAFFQDNFEYSLTTDLTSDGRHPLVTLVEERRPAYCVYFASAMALMMRLQEVPTRVVSGFVPGEVNPLSGRVIVRNRDAHAWVEVWSPEESRFVAFDPTPGSSRRQLMGHNQSIGYVSALVDTIRSAARRIWLILKYEPSEGVITIIISPLSWAILGSVGFVIIRKRMKKNKISQFRDQPSTDTRLHHAYERYQLSLQNAGITPSPSETDDELLDRLGMLGDSAVVNAAEAFLARYRAARFGSKNISSGEELEKLAKLSTDV